MLYKCLNTNWDQERTIRMSLHSAHDQPFCGDQEGRLSMGSCFGFLCFSGFFSAATKSGSMEKFQMVAGLLLGLVRSKLYSR